MTASAQLGFALDLSAPRAEESDETEQELEEAGDRERAGERLLATL